MRPSTAASPLIDTAPVYGFGRSEEIVGKALAEGGRRAGVVLATKVGLNSKNEQPFRNGSRVRILKEIDNSLRRLRTDVIDLYQVHWPDPKTPVEETADAMAELLKAGKIRAIGVSNFSPAQMDRVCRPAPLHAVQPPYNLFEARHRGGCVSLCSLVGWPLLAYGALCRGLLAGRMQADTQFPDSDLRSKDPKFQRPHYGEYLAAVSALDRLAQERFGKRVIHLALRWVLDRAPTRSRCGGPPPWPTRSGERRAGLDNRWGFNAGDRPHRRAACSRTARAGIYGAAGTGGGVSMSR